MATVARRTEVIVTASGKGGTGKTLLLASLGYALQRAGHRVLFVDADTATDGLSLFLLGPRGWEQASKNTSDATFSSYLRRHKKSGIGPIIPLTINRGEADDHGQIYHAIISGKDLYGDFEGDPQQSPILDLPKESYGNAVNDLFVALRSTQEWDYVLVDTRGGFGFTSTDVCALADSFILVTEPDFTSFYQLRNLLRRISGVAAEYNKKSILRAVIINKATEGVSPSDAPNELVQRIDMDKIEVKFRSLLADEFSIKYEDTYPVPLDIEAVKAYKNQRLTYLQAPESIYSFATLKAFSGMLTSVTEPWAEDRYVRWNQLIDEVSSAINAENAQRFEKAAALAQKEVELTRLREQVDRLQKSLDLTSDERESLKKQYERELARTEFSDRNSLIDKFKRNLPGRLLKPDAFRLDRDNSEHLVGRAEDIDNLVQQCRAKTIVFLEGESGSGKSALVRSGLLPRLKGDKSILPLMLADLWIDHWEEGPVRALKDAMIQSGAFDPVEMVKLGKGEKKAAARPVSTLSIIERQLARLNDEQGRTPLIIFDQFDDYQGRNRERFLPKHTWLSPQTLTRENVFWEVMARLLKKEKVRCLFVTRSDAAAGLTSVQFLGPVQALRLDRVRSPYIAELLTRLAEGKPGTPVIAYPETGWNKLRDRIVRDISNHEVVLPQQFKIVLGGIQSLTRLSITEYERVGGASGIEVLHVERQISGTARKAGLMESQVRAILVTLVDASNPTKTRSCTTGELASAASKMGGQQVTAEKLNIALEELERGELLRSASELESGVTAYRLDHDYLTRGIMAAEQRANRWRYLLEDGANAFETAGSHFMRWKAMLPIGTQFRLAWERLHGTIRYGAQRHYALTSLVRFLPIVLLFVAVSYGSVKFSRRTEELATRETTRDIWLKFEFRNGVSTQDLEGAWLLAGETNTRVREEFVWQLLVLLSQNDAG